MKGNRLIFDELLSTIKEAYGEQVIIEAVQSFKNDELLIEGQYPFLDNASMRGRNSGTQMKIFRTHGYNNTDNVIQCAFKVPNEGLIHCFNRLDNRFQSSEEIKQKAIRFDSNRKPSQLNPNKIHQLKHSFLNFDSK